MKRYIFLAILSVINLIAIASSPKLASEKIFEDIDLYDPSLSVTIMERQDQTVKTLSFKNKPDLQKKIKKALDSDKEKAVSKSLVSDNGEISESIIIINDDEEINIGLSNSRTKEVYFFMRKVYRRNSNTVKSSSKSTKSTRTKKSSSNIKTKHRGNKSQNRMKSFNSEQLIDDGNLIVIETYNFDKLSEI